MTVLAAATTGVSPDVPGRLPFVEEYVLDKKWTVSYKDLKNFP